MINSFADIIDLWPSAEAFADAVGTTGANARKMRARNSISSEYWEATVAAAAERELGGVTLEALAKIAATRKGRAA